MAEKKGSEANSCGSLLEPVVSACSSKMASDRLCRKPASELLSPANRETYYWYHDYQQVAKDGGEGRAGYRQGSFQRLFPQVQPPKIHPASTVRLPRAQGV